MIRATGAAVLLVLTLVNAAACASKKQPQATAPPPPAASTTTPLPAPNVSAATLEDVALTRTAIQARRQAIVTAAMDLTPAESDVFWPLYRDYRNDMAKVDDRLVNLILVYASNYESLSDEMASTLLGDYLDIERARVDVKNVHVPRFGRALPAKKVVRFFQIDNKIDKTLQAELAADIPLTR